ncbi:hydrogen peroxide-inducible genes activator [Conexibacter stalactiti]|uniref:hydrogen peroxide-inducible genes activator n=1 Tax=Conexibacter stalactiti TaxID=1940611 RepID=UPI00384A48EB
MGTSDRAAAVPRRSGRSGPTLAQLRAFVAVCEMRHFGAAARRLGLGQSTLSEALAALEASVGARLVERGARRVIVTPEGRRLLPHAQGAVTAADAFEQAASGIGGLLAGPLRIGLIPTVAPYLLPALLARLDRDAPELELHVREDQTETLLGALRDGAVDAAVLALPAGEEGIGELPLYEEEFVVVVPAGHPWAGREDLAPEAVGSAGLLLLEPGHCLRDQTLALCRGVGGAGGAGGAAARAGVAAEERAVSLPTIVQLVAGGLGITVLPASAQRVETRRTRVATARFAGQPRPGRQIGLAFRTSAGREQEWEQLAALIRAAVRRARLPVRATPPT